MNNDELDTMAVQHDSSIKEQIKIQDGTFKWGNDDPVTLKDINFSVKPKSLIPTDRWGHAESCIYFT